jgi:hypothetical protein
MIGPLIGVLAFATGVLIGLRLFRDDVALAKGQIRAWWNERKSRP